MKFKTILKLFVLVFLASISLFTDAQTTITIGTGTSSSTSFGPIYRSSASSSFDFSRYAYIYDATELNIPTGSVIQKVEWYKNSVDTMVDATYSYLDIWMANTTATTASSTAWSAVTAASTRVFEDSFNVTNNVQATVGWYEFPLASFTYTGNSLQVALDWDCSAVSGNPTSGSFMWLYGSAPATRSFYANSGSQPATLSSTSASRPNIRITYTYTPPALDAGLDAILSPNAVSCVGSQSVQVDLKNFGTNTLTSATINWSVDGVAQTANSWTGSLTTGSNASVTLGTIAMTAGTSKNLKVWTSAPNAGTDGAAYNDTLDRTLLTGMSGEYTVGGTGTPDYSTLTAAIADVTANGACDDIRLLVHEGTYTGQYTIGNISGLGATASLEIVSHPSNTNLPVFTYAGTASTDNYVFKFDNATYVILDSLEINATGTTYGRVLEYANNNSYVSVTNSTLRGVLGTSTSTFMAVVFCNTSSSLDENLTFDNNKILNGAYGIYIYGSSAAPEAGNKITNNIIDSFHYYGVYSYYQQGNEISGNLVRDANTYTSPRGLYCLYNSSALINKNNVIIGGTSAPNGMYLDYNDGTVVAPTIITNNMISMYSTSASSTVTGMEVYAAENNYVANNTISVLGGSSSSRALYVYASATTDTVKAYNNMLVNYGSGYALYAGATTTFSASNNNAYYAFSGNIAYWGAAITSISALQSANSMDANSIVTTPQFTSSVDLHTTSADLDAAAMVLTYVTDDIDGDARNATTPDIGADEFTPPPVDAGINSMIGGSFCAGTINTDVILNNYATDTLKTVKIVRQVSVNGAAFTSLDTLDWIGLLPSGQSVTVSLGTYTIGTDIYNFKFYTSKPNTFNDPNNTNDTLTTAAIQAAMQGTYTVGGTMPDYASFALLGADLGAKGMCNDVIIDVREGIYNEQIVVGPITGLSAMNTLTVRSDAANTAMPVITNAATGAADNYVVLFENTSYVSVDGIEIRATGTTYATAVEFNLNNSNISLTNNKIVGLSNPTSTSTNIATVYFNSTGANDHVVFDNNKIYNGSYGFYAYGSSSNRSSANEFTNNTIDSFYYRGIYSYYQDSSVMTGNFIRDNNGYSSPAGIYALYNVPTTISKNEVYIGGTSGANGMYLDYNDGTPADPVIISNNMISMYSTSATGTMTGMEVYNAENNIVANNSIAVYGGSTSGRALYLYASGAGDSTYAYNNALANFGSGYALYGGSSTAIKASDYNNVYATGANAAYWGGAQTTLTDLQTASGLDANSVSVNPVFLSSMNLHAKGVGMNDVGTSLTYVTDDIDGDTRNATTSDIGADEYTHPVNDIAVVEILNEVARCAVTSQEVRAVITNFGTATQTSYNMTVLVSGAVTQTLTASGSTSLPTGALDTISLGTLSTAVGGIFNFTAYNVLTGDEDLSNDTVMLNGVKVDALPAVPAISNKVVCIADAGSVALEATGAVSYAWYATDTSSVTLSTSSTYTASLTSTDTFYVQGLYSTSLSVGPADNNYGSGSNYSSVGTSGLVFEAIKAVTIDSVSVYTNGAGNVVVIIEDASGSVIHTNTVAVTTSGLQRIPVGATIAPGSGYEMLATGTTTGGLYRNSAGSSFPYTESSGSITITDGTLSGYYYFFYDWAVTAEGCSSPLKPVIVTVNETAIPTIANDTICQGDDAYLNVTSVGNQITWYDSPMSTTPIAVGYSYLATNVDSTTTFYVKDLGANGCTSLVKEVKVVVKATPATPVASDTAVCAGEMVTLMATGTTGILSWYANANGGTALATGNMFTTPTLSSTKVYYVSEMIDGCIGNREDVIVTVNAVPSAPNVSSISPICAGSSATLMATSGANVMWYNTEMTSVLGSGTNYMTGALAATDTFYAIDMQNGCMSTSTQVIVTVNDVPMAPTATADSVCSGNVAMLSAVSTGTNVWYDANDMMVFSGDMFTTPALSTSTSYYVVATSASCQSSKTWVIALVSPNVDADQSVTICEGETVNLVLASDMMYNWYSDATSTTVLSAGPMYAAAPTSTDTFYAQAVGGNCTDERTMLIVNVDAAASLTSVSGATICEGETAELASAGSGTITWYASPKSTMALSTGAAYTTSALTATSIYYAEATNGNCTSDRLPAIVTVNPLPNVGFSAEDHGSRVFVSANETNVGYIHTWSIGDTTISGGSSAYVDSNAIGTVSVTHTIVNSITGCTSTLTKEVTISTASVSELSIANIGMYPNPNTGRFFITLPKVDEVYALTMTNIAGQEVYSTTELTSDNNTVNVNVPAGMYFVQVSDAVSTVTIKVMVK